MNERDRVISEISCGLPTRNDPPELLLMRRLVVELENQLCEAEGAARILLEGLHEVLRNVLRTVQRAESALLDGAPRIAADELRALAAKLGKTVAPQAAARN